MHARKWIPTFLLSGFIAAPAAAFTVKPGAWEWEQNSYTNEITKRKICITPKEAGNIFEANYHANGVLIPPYLPEECQGKITRKRSNSYDYEAACGFDYGKVQFVMTIKKISNSELVTTASTLGEFDHKQSKSRMESRVKKISEDETLIESRSESTLFRGKKDSTVTKTATRLKKINADEFVMHAETWTGDEGGHSTKMKLTRIYRYIGPTCTDPDEEKNSARQKTEDRQESPANADDE